MDICPTRCYADGKDVIIEDSTKQTLRLCLENGEGFEQLLTAVREAHAVWQTHDEAENAGTDDAAKLFEEFFPQPSPTKKARKKG